MRAPKSRIDRSQKWLARFRRKVPEPAAEPEPALEPGPEIVLPPELYATIAQRARLLGVEPGWVACRLLREAIEQREQAESLQGRWKSLSPREREIIALLRQAQTYNQIADRLVISPETVKVHLRSALNKLGLSGKAQLLETLEEAGWDEKE